MSKLDQIRALPARTMFVSPKAEPQAQKKTSALLVPVLNAVDSDRLTQEPTCKPKTKDRHKPGYQKEYQREYQKRRRAEAKALKTQGGSSATTQPAGLSCGQGAGSKG